MIMKNWRLFLVLILIIFLGLAAVIVIFSSNKKTPVASQPVAAFPNDTKGDYNNFHNLIPGKSTLADLKRAAGEPTNSKVVEGNQHLYYRAPFDNKNPILVKDGVLIYSSEYVFGNYRGTYSDFINAYGLPDKIFYDQGGLSWRVFYKQGLAVQESANEIARIIYFVPNNIQLFYNTVLKDFNMSENPIGLR